MKRINVPQAARLLEYVRKARPKRLQDIAHHLGVSRNTANRLLILLRQEFDVSVFWHPKTGYRVETYGRFRPERLAKTARRADARIGIVELEWSLRLLSRPGGITRRELGERLGGRSWRWAHTLIGVLRHIGCGIVAGNDGRLYLIDSGPFVVPPGSHDTSEISSIRTRKHD